MMDVIANVSALCHWTKRAAPEAPGMWHGVHWWPDSEDRFKERSVIFPALVVVYAIRNPVISLAYLRYRYHLSHRIRRVVANENTSLPYQQIAQEVKAPRERLKYALETGLQVTALDGLFWFGSQRIAADIQRLRKSGMRITTSAISVYDSITATRRLFPVYRIVANNK